jgi:hypothetical protein
MVPVKMIDDVVLERLQDTSDIRQLFSDGIAVRIELILHNELFKEPVPNRKHLVV